MKKNTTRKGLALLSTFALTFAGLVGFAAPAQANTVLLAPSVGTEYAVPLDEMFILETRYATGSNGFDEDMTVTVVDADLGLDSVVYTVNADGTGGDQVTDGLGDDNDTFEESYAAPAVGAKSYIVLIPGAGTTTFSVKVSTGFEAGAMSPERTVTFHKAADYTWNLSFTTPVIGDAELVATVSTTPQLNIAQFAGNVELGFAKVDTDGDLLDADDGRSDFTGSSFTDGTLATNSDAERQTNGSYEWTVDSTDPVSSALPYAAQILYAGAEVGTRQVIKPAAETIDTLATPKLVVSANTKGNEIRLGTTSVTVETTAYSSYTNATTNTVAAAGETVTVYIYDEDLNAKASVAAGGKTLTSTTIDGEIKITATVGAKGKVSIPIALTGLKANDSFGVQVEAQNATIVAAGADWVEFDVVPTEAGQMVDHNLVGWGSAWKVAHGTHTIRFAALDNFDQPLATAGYRVILSNGTGGDEVAQPVVNGVATFSVNTKDSEDDAVAQFSAQLQAPDGVDLVDSGIAVTLAVNIGAANAAATVSVDGANAANKYVIADVIDLNLEDMASANTRLGETAPDTGASTFITGRIADANGVGTYGNVTISAPGLLFEAATPGNKSVFSVGSITIQTDAFGAYEVEVYSNTAGKVAVTVTSGAASQVVTLTFDDAALDTGTVLAINAPASVTPGSTLIVKATLVDEYGNTVSAGTNETVTVAYDGPGLPLTSPAAFVAGALQFGVLLGANDSGTATITVSVYEGDDKISVQKTIVIGTAGNVGAVATWTSNQNDGTVKMYAKNIVGAGKVQFMVNGEEIAWVRAANTSDSKLRLAGAEGAAYLVRTVDLVEGQKNVLEIYVDGVRTTRTAYTY